MSETARITHRTNPLMRIVPLLVLVAFAAATVSATLVTHRVVHDQQGRILHERSVEFASQVSGSTTTITYALKLMGGVYLLSPDHPQAFTTIAQSLVRGDVSQVGVADRRDGQVIPRLVVGSGSTVGSPLDATRADIVARALDGADAAADIIALENGHESLFRVVPIVGDTIVYYESGIDPTKSISTSSAASPLKSLDAIVYASATPRADRVMFSTTGRPRLTGTLDSRHISVGVERWLVVVSPKESLIGDLAPKVPWFLLAGGLAEAFLAGAVAEVLVRRRAYALRLVVDRTHDLRESHAELESARGAAEQANRSKSEFLSRMSHELRTPLNAVLGFAQVLEFDHPTDSQRESIEHIRKGGTHLLALINEILEISRIETGDLALSPEPVLIAELFGDVVSMMQPLATQHGVALSCEFSELDERYVFADRQRSQQILINLVSNVIKYNRPDGAVTLSCELDEDGERVRLKVVDTGIGVSAEHRTLLFAPFERLGAAETGVEGTGIGLTLSLRLAQAMGGTIDFDSTPGVGSTFWLEIALVEGPLEQFDRRAAAPAELGLPTRGADGERRIVYIEDNLANLRLMEKVFERRDDIDIIPAMQGRLGVELVREHRPDAVLLDLHLPDISGDQVLEQLRQDARTSGIPVIMISADATRGQADRLLQAGATAYLTKPFDVHELLNIVNEALTGPPQP